MSKKHSPDRLPKPPLWLVLISLSMVALLIAAFLIAKNIGIHNPLNQTRANHPLPNTTLAPRTASQGNPLEFTINSSQDVAQPSDQSAPVTQSFASNVMQGDLNGQSITIHSGFASFSIETAHVCNFVNTATQSTLSNLLKNFGRGGLLRVGGGTVDTTGWDGQSNSPCPTANLEDTATITPPMVQQLLEFAHSIGWKVIWSIGLQLTPQEAADDAASTIHIANSIGQGDASPLLAIAIGNEPEQDLQHGKASYQQFRTLWEAEARAIKGRLPSVTLFGPDTCCTTNDQWFKDFMTDDGSQIHSASDHIYPTSAYTNHTPTIVQILSPEAMENTVETIDDLRKSAAAQHLPLLISETNSISNTPTPNVGLSFGQALWAADYLFTAQEHGVVALDFHGGMPGDATSPFRGNNETVTVQSTYYGMLFFEQAVANGGHTVAVQSPDDSNLNVTAHAIRDKDGKLYVAIINKGGQAADIHIHTGRTQSQKAQVIRLDAPGADAQQGFQLGGASVDATGTWSARNVENVPVSNNVASLSVTGYSAALITFSPTS